MEKAVGGDPRVSAEGRSPSACLLEARAVSKSFSGARVLSDVSLVIREGEVRALAGQNGSGKSTLVKIFSGYHAPDAGQVLLLGREVHHVSHDAEAARRLHFIHQDLALLPGLNVIDNLAIGFGYATHRSGRINWRQERAAIREALASLELEIDIEAPVQTLTRMQQTMLAVIRATRHWSDSRGVLVLDEPTTSFSAHETALLFSVIRQITERGGGVLYITHRLDEIHELADTVTILRDGRVVHDGVVADLAAGGLVEAIVGHPLATGYSPSHDASAAGRVVVEVRSARSGALESLDADVHEGEIIGFAGLDGSGREEIGVLLAGFRSPTAGSVRLANADSAHDAASGLRQAVAFVPSERRTNGVFPLMDVREHITLPRIGSFWRKFKISRSAERKDAQAWVEKLDVRPPTTTPLVSSLSGGNQQKVMLARSLSMTPRVLVVDEPTQGVDVGAKQTIHEMLRLVAGTGVAIVVISSDVDELEQISDRVVVLSNGRVARELAGADVSTASILHAMLTPVGHRVGPETQYPASPEAKELLE